MLANIDVLEKELETLNTREVRRKKNKMILFKDFIFLI
jgi:hypothetical protein